MVIIKLIIPEVPPEMLKNFGSYYDAILMRALEEIRNEANTKSLSLSTL